MFDIRRRRSVIKLWKDIDEGSKTQWDQLETTEFIESSKPSEAGTSFETLGLDANESTDLRQRWLDACRPPRLQSQETLEKEVSSPVSKDMESSSPTIMSLSAITDEGRRQVGSDCLIQYSIILTLHRQKKQEVASGVCGTYPSVLPK